MFQWSASNWYFFPERGCTIPTTVLFATTSSPCVCCFVLFNRYWGIVFFFWLCNVQGLHGEGDAPFTVDSNFRIFEFGGWNNGVRHSNDVLQARANVKNSKYKDVYGIVHKAFAPAIVGMSGDLLPS